MRSLLGGGGGGGEVDAFSFMPTAARTAMLTECIWFPQTKNKVTWTRSLSAPSAPMGNISLRRHWTGEGQRFYKRFILDDVAKYKVVTVMDFVELGGGLRSYSVSSEVQIRRPPSVAQLAGDEI